MNKSKNTTCPYGVLQFKKTLHSIPLTVDMLDFTGLSRGENNLLEWKTAAEESND
ncbi:MAG: hypothetical protein ACO1O6_10945 [Bacteroidota bacterium]